MTFCVVARLAETCIPVKFSSVLDLMPMYIVLYISITIVQSDTGKYLSFVTYGIITHATSTVETHNPALPVSPSTDQHCGDMRESFKGLTDVGEPSLIEEYLLQDEGGHCLGELAA